MPSPDFRCFPNDSSKRSMALKDAKEKLWHIFNLAQLYCANSVYQDCISEAEKQLNHLHYIVAIDKPLIIEKADWMSKEGIVTTKDFVEVRGSYFEKDRDKFRTLVKNSYGLELEDGFGNTVEAGIVLVVDGSSPAEILFSLFTLLHEYGHHVYKFPASKEESGIASHGVVGFDADEMMAQWYAVRALKRLEQQIATNPGVAEACSDAGIEADMLSMFTNAVAGISEGRGREFFQGDYLVHQAITAFFSCDDNHPRRQLVSWLESAVLRRRTSWPSTADEKSGFERDAHLLAVLLRTEYPEDPYVDILPDPDHLVEAIVSDVEFKVPTPNSDTSGKDISFLSYIAQLLPVMSGVPYGSAVSVGRLPGNAYQGRALQYAGVLCGICKKRLENGKCFEHS